MSTLSSEFAETADTIRLPGPAAWNAEDARSPAVPPPEPPARGQPRSAWLPEGADGWLIGCVLALLGFGLLMVLSASIAMRPDNPFHFAIRQAVAAGLGLLLAYLAVRTPLADLQKVAGSLMLLSFLLAILVLAFGKTVNGSTRWLSVAGVSVQVSEPIKLFLVIWLASYLVRQRDPVRTEIRGFIVPVAVAGAISALILAERDLGGAAVAFATALGLLWVGGVPLSRFMLWLLPVIAILPVLILTQGYRMLRLLAYLDPWADPQNSGYQLVNSLMAFGRGGWFGVGLGGSVQKLLYLPEVHTDFIFAVVGEELGVIGTLGVLIAFGFLVWRIFHVAERCAAVGHGFAAYLCYGVGLFIGLQAFINIGVALGLLPTKGLTLPLISYGSNSLVMTLTALGCVVRASHESTRLLNLRPTMRSRA